MTKTDDLRGASKVPAVRWQLPVVLLVRVCIMPQKIIGVLEYWRNGKTGIFG